MQPMNIPRITAPTDLSQTSIAIVIGTQIFGVPAVELGDAFGFQPLDSDLTSWAAITRAAGFDAFVATPSSANLRTLLTDETGTGAAVFANAPTITGTPVFSGVPSLTGGALSFPATQVPSAGANDLDDYEENTTTPTPTADSGTFTTVSASLKYTKVGNVVVFTVTITITTAGTAAGAIIVPLPFTPAATAASVGRETSVTGFMVQGITSGAFVRIFKYDNTTIIGSGRTVILTGVFHT